MTKVLHILTDSNIGGAGRYLINYLKHCDRSRVDLRVVLPRGSLLKAEVLALDTPVIEVDGIAEKSFSLRAVKELKQVISRENPDIIHTHGSLSGRIAGRQCGPGCSTPDIAYFHWRGISREGLSTGSMG